MRVHRFVDEIIRTIRDRQREVSTRTFQADLKRLPIINETATDLIALNIVGKFKEVRDEFEKGFDTEVGDMS